MKSPFLKLLFIRICIIHMYPLKAQFVPHFDLILHFAGKLNVFIRSRRGVWAGWEGI